MQINKYPIFTLRESLEKKSVDKKVLINICNIKQYDITDTNIALSKLYNLPKTRYIECKNNNLIKLGNIDTFPILSYFHISNFICVNGVKSVLNKVPFDHESFDKCCNELNKYMFTNSFTNLSVMRMATKDVEGRWGNILESINKYFSDYTLDLYLPKNEL